MWSASLARKQPFLDPWQLVCQPAQPDSDSAREILERTMNEDHSLGHSIVQAIKFLWDVYGDLEMLIESLDEALEKEKWVPTHKNRVTDWLSNSLDADRWLLPAIYRYYAPQQPGGAAHNLKQTTRVVAIVINLSPTSHPEAACLVAAVRFPKPKAYNEIWDKLDASDDEPCGSERVTEFLANKDGVQQIPEDLLRDDFFPGAEIGFGFTVPLCSLTNAQAAKDRIVEPILTEAKKLVRGR
jgi:hypothetical protein